MPDDIPDFDEASALDLLASGADVLGTRAVGPCPDANVLGAISDGSLAPEIRVALETHVSLCQGCRGIAAALSVLAGPEGGPLPGALSTVGLPEAPPHAEEEAPRTFGPYRLLRRIGSGGMGDVFEAVHEDRGRPEALKQVRAGLEANPRAVDRFRAEVRALATLTHEHVVPLYDAGVIDGIPYYTMPLLPGPSLRDVLEAIRATPEPFPGALALAVLDRHRVPAAGVPGEGPEATYARRMAALLAGPAAALGALHAAGLVHRDVKPGNLLIDARGRAVLTDFGLVRGESARLTRTGEALGTPAYMAPEQLEPGATVDGRADVHGLCSTLYEAVTRHRPFEGSTAAETVGRILRGSVSPPLRHNPHLPPDLVAVLSRGLERRPTDRIPDGRALASDLEAIAQGRSVSTRPVPRVTRTARVLRRRWKPLVAVGSLLLATGTWAYLRPGHLSVRTTPSAQILLDGVDVGVSPLEDRPLHAGEHHVEARHPKFAPFDRTIAVSRGGTYALDAALRALDPVDPETVRLLTEAEGLRRHEVDVRPLREPQPMASVLVLGPRGAFREAPATLVLWAERSAKQVVVTLRRLDADGTATVVYESPAATVFRRTQVPIPEAIHARILPGTAWRVSVRVGDAPLDPPAAFRMLAPDDVERVERRLALLTRARAPDDPSSDVLAAELLLDAGLLADAVDRAGGLRERLGDRREIARLALAALEEAGLRDSTPWIEWATVYLRATK